MNEEFQENTEKLESGEQSQDEGVVSEEEKSPPRRKKARRKSLKNFSSMSTIEIDAFIQDWLNKEERQNLTFRKKLSQFGQEYNCTIRFPNHPLSNLNDETAFKVIKTTILGK